MSAFENIIVPPATPDPDAVIVKRVRSSVRGWDDFEGTTITVEDLEVAYGPQWRAVVAFLRCVAVLSEDEANRLAAARVAWVAQDTWDSQFAWAARAAWVAWDAQVAWFARAAGDARAAWAAIRDAARAIYAWHLCDDTYTEAHRDTLIGPWREVIGEPEYVLSAEQIGGES